MRTLQPILLIADMLASPFYLIVYAIGKEKANKAKKIPRLDFSTKLG
jgi:hypothetical protein